MGPGHGWEERPASGRQIERVLTAVLENTSQGPGYRAVSGREPAGGGHVTAGLGPQPRV